MGEQLPAIDKALDDVRHQLAAAELMDTGVYAENGKRSKTCGVKRRGMSCPDCGQWLHFAATLREMARSVVRHQTSVKHQRALGTVR